MRLPIQAFGLLATITLSGCGGGSGFGAAGGALGAKSGSSDKPQSREEAGGIEIEDDENTTADHPAQVSGAFLASCGPAGVETLGLPEGREAIGCGIAKFPGLAKYDGKVEIGPVTFKDTSGRVETVERSRFTAASTDSSYHVTADLPAGMLARIEAITGDVAIDGRPPARVRFVNQQVVGGWPVGTASYTFDPDHPPTTAEIAAPKPAPESAPIAAAPPSATATGTDAAASDPANDYCSPFGASCIPMISVEANVNNGDAPRLIDDDPSNYWAAVDEDGKEKSSAEITVRFSGNGHLVAGFGFATPVDSTMDIKVSIKGAGGNGPILFSGTGSNANAILALGIFPFVAGATEAKVVLSNCTPKPCRLIGLRFAEM